MVEVQGFRTTNHTGILWTLGGRGVRGVCLSFFFLFTCPYKFRAGVGPYPHSYNSLVREAVYSFILEDGVKRTSI